MHQLNEDGNTLRSLGKLISIYSSLIFSSNVRSRIIGGVK